MCWNNGVHQWQWIAIFFYFVRLYLHVNPKINVFWLFFFSWQEVRLKGYVVQWMGVLVQCMYNGCLILQRCGVKLYCGSFCFLELWYYRRYFFLILHCNAYQIYVYCALSLFVCYAMHVYCVFEKMKLDNVTLVNKQIYAQFIINVSCLQNIGMPLSQILQFKP